MKSSSGPIEHMWVGSNWRKGDRLSLIISVQRGQPNDSYFFYGVEGDLEEARSVI
jgi:hypothetical protein